MAPIAYWEWRGDACICDHAPDDHGRFGCERADCICDAWWRRGAPAAYPPGV